MGGKYEIEVRQRFVLPLSGEESYDWRQVYLGDSVVYALRAALKARRRSDVVCVRWTWR